MFISTSNANPKTTTLNVIRVRKNLNYIAKFRLPISITKYINLCLIFHTIYINDFIIVSDIKLNL